MSRISVASLVVPPLGGLVLAFSLVGCAGSTPSSSPAEPAGSGAASAKPRPLPPGVGPQRGGKAGLAALESAKKKARDGDLAGAATDAERAIAEAPGQAEPYLLLASVRGMQEDAAGTRAALEQGLAAVPRSMALHHALGMLLLEAGDNPGALRELEQAKALLGVEKNGEVYADLAYAYLFAGKLDEAEKLAAEARALDGKAYAPAFTHGEALLRLKRYPEAVKAYRAASELAPDQALPQQRLASALMKSGDFAGAVPVLAKLVSAKGDDAGLQAAYAQALLESGRPKDALAPAQAALALAPDQAPLRELLATVQEAAGDKAAAKKTRAGGKKK